MPANRVELQASLSAREALRYSPAGVPLLSAVLSHESGQTVGGVTLPFDDGAVALEAVAAAAGAR